MGVQAFGPEAPIEGFDKGVVSGFSGPGEVQDDVVRIRPEVEIPADKLRPLIDPDCVRISATGTPSAPCFRMNAFCASENLLAFIVFRSSQPRENDTENYNQKRSSLAGADHRMRLAVAGMR